jgi:cytochrome c biogenesis protein CcdA
MIALGSVLALPSLQAQFATAAGPASNWLNARFSSFAPAGLAGQFAVGALMGIVWSPCVGPTLGAAVVLASTGQNLAEAAGTMLAFGIGAALPLLLIAFAWRTTSRDRSRLIAIGSRAKQAMGVLLILIGSMILAGLDKRVEAALVQISPDWLTRLTTAF